MGCVNDSCVKPSRYRALDDWSTRNLDSDDVEMEAWSCMTQELLKYILIPGC